VFQRVLVANRGEIAVRIIRACHEMGIEAVAIYSTADADSLPVRMADDSVCIGPPPNRDSYLNIPNILTAGMMKNCDAVHPGYGNLSEIAAFAESAEACGLKFIGPKPATMELMQDKGVAKQKMREAGVPIVPGTEGKMWKPADAAQAIKRLGYPVMLKAAAGGGGRGIRILHTPEDLERLLPQAQAEAEAAFGRGEIYFERYIEEPKHVEVQIFGDSKGRVIHLGERDCSIQNLRHQKLLEESPCAALTRAQRKHLTEAAVRGGRAIGYENAGTVEFLIDRQGRFYFLEMNCRIQVEHPVTEMVTGVDIVKEQLRVAAGEPLSIAQGEIEPNGHAIECRITAEDPERGFLANAGSVERYLPPAGPGVRVDSHLFPGYEVPPFYDPLLAKVIAWGRDRTEAIQRMQRALRELEIGPIKTTLPFHQRVVTNGFFRRGEVYTNFIRRRLALDTV